VAVIVADSDVLIDYLRGRDPAASRVALELDLGQLRTTVISRFELLAGARGQRHELATRDLLAAIPALALGTDAADRAADLHRSLAASGAGIAMADCLIAGIVLTVDGILLTRNRRHFDRVPGLRLGNLVD